MAPTGKRTRQTAESENPSSSASTSTPPSASMAPPTPSSRPATRRALQATVSLSDLGSPNNNPAVGAMTPPETPSPNRPILTRSATTRAPGNSPLTRAASMFTPSRRDDAPLSPAGSTFASGSGSGFGSGSLASSYIGLGTPSGVSGPRTRSGLLTRTQSSPSLASPGALKACLAPGGSSTGKGGPEDVFGFGGRKYGRGKENIPPRKEDEENQRKRLRVTSGPRSVSSRGRSGSVASVRSESSSSASSYYSCGPGLLSPSPSPSTPASSRSSVDPLDLIGSELDVDRTPTKARPVRDTRVMPTPPASSSPFLAATSTDIDSARRRMSLVKMASTSSLATISSSEDASGSDTETETDPDPFTASSPSKYKPKNAYKHLKSLLRLSATADKSTSDGIIGREEEKDALRAYFSMRSDKDVGMYVSGPPGTGKTALVTAMCKEMAREGAKVVELGCMGLKVNDVWRRLGQGLGCGVTEEEVGRYMAQNTRDTLIILDEIDSLLPAPPAMPTSATSHLLSKIFSFPLLSTANRTVKLIAISNTLDLTVRAKLVLPSGAQPAVLPFKAYGATDMARIVFARLETITVGEDAVKVDLKAVELLTRKVEAQNGDLRMCLATLAAAVSLAEAEWVKKTLSASDLGAATTPLIKVSLPHVIKAFSSHTQQLKAAAGSAHPSATTSGGVESATARKIRSVPLQGKMVLVSILVYLSRSRAGLPGIPTCTTSSASSGPSPSSTPHRHGDLTTSNLYATYSALMSHESSPFPPAAESDYRDLLSNLETLGLVSIVGFGGGSYAMSTSLSGSGASRGSASSRSKNSAGAPRVELCVRDDEVRQGLGLGEVGQDGIAQGKGRADEEVGKVWAREEVKVVRQREKIARAAEALKAVSAEQE